MPSSWQMIPAATLREEERRSTADLWAQQQRAQLAQSWADDWRRQMEQWQQQMQQAGSDFLDQEQQTAVGPPARVPEDNTPSGPSPLPVEQAGSLRQAERASMAPSAAEQYGTQGIGRPGQTGPLEPLRPGITALSNAVGEGLTREGMTAGEIGTGAAMRGETAAHPNTPYGIAEGLLRGLGRFGAEAVTQGPGQAVEQAVQRREATPEQFAGQKGISEALLAPSNLVGVGEVRAAARAVPRLAGKAVDALATPNVLTRGMGITPELAAVAKTPFARATESVIKRAQGTPAQAAELRPPKKGYAGNINLSKVMPVEVRPLIDEVVNSNNQWAGRRRGVITDKEALKNAAATGLGTPIEDWLKSKPGRAFNEEEALALGNTLVAVGKDYDGMLTEAAALRAAGKMTPAAEAALAEKALEFAALAGVRAGVAAEAGRALHSFKLALTGTGASTEKAIQQAMKQIGDPAQFQKWLEAFNKIDPADTRGRYKMLQALYKPTIWDKIDTWRYASMLSGYKTHLANITSNAGTSLVRPGEKLLAGFGREAAEDVKGMLQAIPQGLAVFGDTLRHGVTAEQAAKADNIRPRAFGDSKLGRAVQLPLDFLSAADEMFKAVNTSGALRARAWQEAKGNQAEFVRLLGDPSDTMVAYADQAAKRATFQEDPGQFVNALMGLRRVNGPTRLAVNAFVPFIRTPANIYRRGVELAVQPMTGPVKIGKALAKGDTRVAREEAAKTAIAATTAAGLYSMAQSGQLSGMGPSDATKRQALEATGWQANSIKIGDRWIGYGNLGPIAVQMAAVAALAEGQKEGQKPDHEAAGEVVKRIANTMLDVSYLKGIGDIFKAAQGMLPWDSVVKNFAGSMVPYGSLQASVERTVNPEVQATESIPEYLGSRIPGVSGAVATEPNVYGQPRGFRESDTFSTALNAALPWKNTRQQEDAVANEVGRLIQAGQAVSVRKFGDDYAGAPQTGEQRRALQTKAGQLAHSYLADYISRPEYAGLSDVQKATTLNKALGTAYELADAEMGNQIARDPKHQALLAWSETAQYAGVKGTGEQIRQQNYEISQAKALLSEYRQRLGEGRGNAQMIKDNKEMYLLAQRPRLNSEYLSKLKTAIDQHFGGALSEAEKEGLLGAGNTVLPIGSRR